MSTACTAFTLQVDEAQYGLTPCCSSMSPSVSHLCVSVRQHLSLCCIQLYRSLNDGCSPVQSAGFSTQGWLRSCLLRRSVCLAGRGAGNLKHRSRQVPFVPLIHDEHDISHHNRIVRQLTPLSPTLSHNSDPPCRRLRALHDRNRRLCTPL